MRLERIRAEGLKRSDFDYYLAPVTVICGENGGGKTEIIDAIHLLALGLGSSTELPKNADGIMRLARGSEIGVRGLLSLDDGASTTIARKWKRSAKDGKVKEHIDEIAHLPRTAGVEERRMQIKGVLGSLVDAWHPEEILQLSSGKLRKRLLDLIPRENMAPERWVPAGCPDWAKPERDESILEWAHRAIVRARSRREDAYSRRREASAVLEQVGEAWQQEESIEPLQKRAADLREEMKHAIRAEQRRKHVDTDRQRLAAMDGEIMDLVQAGFEAEPCLVHLANGFGEFVAEAVQRDLRPWLAKMAELSKGWAEARDRKAKLLKACGGQLNATHFDLEVARETMKTASASAGDQAAAVAKLSAKLDLLREPLPFDACPSCSFDLAAHRAADLAKVEADVGDAKRAMIAGQHLLQEAHEHVAQTEASIVYQEVVVAEEEKRAAYETAKVEVEESYGPLAAELAQLTLSWGYTHKKWSDRWARLQELKADRDRFEMQVEIAEARATEALEQLRPVALIDAEAQALEVKLKELGHRNERRKVHAEATEDLTRAETEVASLSEWVDAFESIETRLLDQCRGWLETTLSRIMRARFTVELRDARGNDTCRPTVDGVDVSTISGGERFEFLGALIVAIAAAQPKVPWRPLILDGFETVSKSNRERFLRSIAAAVESGVISQAVIAGCPDSVPVDIDGVEIIRVASREMVTA